MITQEDLDRRFDYHPPKDTETSGKHERVRAHLKALAYLLNTIVPDGREKAVMMTHLEDAMMWANAGIARNQN